MAKLNDWAYLYHAGQERKKRLLFICKTQSLKDIKTTLDFIIDYCYEKTLMSAPKDKLQNKSNH